MTPGEVLDSFAGKRVLVLGDLMLDEYIFGRATRISQEAPVMVVRQTSTRAVPGGAANVAANIDALGGSATVLGVVGRDLTGDRLREALGARARHVVEDPSRPTTRKLRVVANHSHQVLRIDHEEDAALDPETEDRVTRAFAELIGQSDAVLVSDYQKGCVTERVVAEAVSHARQAGVPIAANPKPASLKWYRGASLVSLNRFEAGDFLGAAGGLSDADAQEAAARLKERLEVERVLITLGSSGMVASGASSYSVPAVKVDVYDEAGAGDTVIATIALSLAAGTFGESALQLAAKLAGAVVQKVGVAVPDTADLSAID